MNLAVEISHVFVRGHRTVILNDVSLTLAPRSFLAILGPNGAGKTTFLNVLTGLTSFKGTVRVLGQDVARLSAFEMTRLRRRIGYVPQLHSRPSPILPLTVREVVEMGRTGVRGLGRRLTRHDREICDEVIHRLELDALADRPFGLLSGGEQRKVHLARGLAQEPDILLLDEPAGHLDLRWQEAICQLIAGLWRTMGLTVVMVSHDPRHLPAGITHVAAFNGGRLLRIGPPSEVIVPDFLTALYGLPLKVVSTVGRYLVLAKGPDEA